MYSGNRLVLDRTEPLLDSRGRKPSAHLLENCYLSHLYEVLICVLILSFLSFLGISSLPKGAYVDESMADTDVPRIQTPVHSTSSRAPRGEFFLVQLCHTVLLCTDVFY